jgi:hypothetical protein
VSKLLKLKLKMMKTTLSTLLLLLITISLKAQVCSPSAIVHREIKAWQTDNNINFAGRNHQIFINPTCPSKDKLLLHLVGSYDDTESTTLFPSLAADSGFHVIVLHYPNLIPVTTQCRNNTDIDCHWKYRQELTFGEDTHSVLTVDTSNCILNRFEKVVQYLDANFSSENWNSFLLNGDSINWPKITISGHSQGGGHAAFMGKHFDLDRVIMFASPNEYSATYSAAAPWISMPGITPASKHYGMGNLYDDAIDFSEQYLVWNGLNMLPFGDTVLVEQANCPYNDTRMLYTNDTTAGNFPAPWHSCMLLDTVVPLDGGNQPIFIEPWQYLLGLCSSLTTGIEELPTAPLQLSIYPNPTQGEVIVSCTEKMKSIQVFNLLGQEQISFTVNAESIQFQPPNTKGCLLVVITTATGRKLSRPLLLSD